jgi:hypothetical protein
VQRNEHRSQPRGLADLLLPYALVDDGILLQQDGSLLTGWTYRGPDMMSAAPAEMDALSARLNSVLRLGTGWMVQCDAIRSRAPGYPKQGAFPDCVTRVIDSPSCCTAQRRTFATQSRDAYRAARQYRPCLWAAENWYVGRHSFRGSRQTNEPPALRYQRRPYGVPVNAHRRNLA